MEDLETWLGRVYQANGYHATLTTCAYGQQI